MTAIACHSADDWQRRLNSKVKLVILASLFRDDFREKPVRAWQSHEVQPYQPHFESAFSLAQHKGQASGTQLLDDSASIKVHARSHFLAREMSGPCFGFRGRLKFESEGTACCLDRSAEAKREEPCRWR